MANAWYWRDSVLEGFKREPDGDLAMVRRKKAKARSKPRLSFSQLVGRELIVLRRKRTTTSTRAIS